METSNLNMETLYYRLIEDYKNTLLYPVNAYYKNSIKELVSKNNTLQNSVQQGFYLDGSFYTSEDYPTKKYLFNPLHESLTEDFLSLKSFVEDLNDQIEELGAYLYSQYSEFKEWAKESKDVRQAFRDYFPDLLYNLYLNSSKELIGILGSHNVIGLLPKNRVRTSHITLSTKFQETIDTLTGFTILI